MWMDNGLALLRAHGETMLALLLAAVVFQGLLLAFLLRRTRKLTGRLREAGVSQYLDLAAALKEQAAAAGRQQRRLDELEGILGDVNRRLTTVVRHVGIRRYNALPDVGGDQSFSVVLLDDNDDGLVLTSLYGRTECRTYAKPIRQGRSAYRLTREEADVLAGAMARRAATGGREVGISGVNR